MSTTVKNKKVRRQVQPQFFFYLHAQSVATCGDQNIGSELIEMHNLNNS